MAHTTNNSKYTCTSTLKSKVSYVLDFVPLFFNLQNIALNVGSLSLYKLSLVATANTSSCLSFSINDAHLWLEGRNFMVYFFHFTPPTSTRTAFPKVHTFAHITSHCMKHYENTKILTNEFHFHTTVHNAPNLVLAQKKIGLRALHVHLHTIAC